MKKKSIPTRKSRSVIIDEDIEEIKPKQKRGKKKKEIMMTEDGYDDKIKEKLLLRNANLFKSALSPSRSKPSQNFQVKYENNFSVAKLPNVNLLVQPISIQELNLPEIIAIKSARLESGSGGSTKDKLKQININKLVRPKGVSKKEEYTLKELKKITRSLGLVQNFSRAEAIKTILEQLRNYGLVESDKYNEIIAGLKKT